MKDQRQDRGSTAKERGIRIQKSLSNTKENVTYSIDYNVNISKINPIVQTSLIEYYEKITHKNDGGKNDGHLSMTKSQFEDFTNQFRDTGIKFIES